jgi:hypothetical protein
MVSRSHYFLPGLLVLLSFAMTGPAFAQAVEKAKSAPIHPALMQVEEDPKLPRVLLIGDSITMGVHGLVAGTAREESECATPGRELRAFRPNCGAP